jgi:hypothetical protein
MQYRGHGNHKMSSLTRSYIKSKIIQTKKNIYSSFYFIVYIRNDCV